MRLIIAILALVIPLAVIPPPAAIAFQGVKAKARAVERRAPRPSRSILDRFQRLTPRQRQQALRQLSPERRKAFEQRLNRLNQLPPKQRQELRKEYQLFRQLSPERQDSFRRLYQRVNKLPKDRRQLLTREFRSLRGLSPQRRLERLSSDEFRSKFSPADRRLLEEMTKTLPEPK